MKRYILTILCIGVCALACPMQSCANGGGTKAELPTSEPAVLAESSEPVESAKMPAYRTAIEGLLKQGSIQDSKTNFPLFFARQFLDVPYVAHTLDVNDE